MEITKAKCISIPENSVVVSGDWFNKACQYETCISAIQEHNIEQKLIIDYLLSKIYVSKGGSINIMCNNSITEFMRHDSRVHILRTIEAEKKDD